MPEIIINVQDEYDKKVNRLRIDRNIKSKRVMIEKIVEEYFNIKEKENNK